MLMMKLIGEPYAGKLHVRFDEGAGKVSSFPLYSTVSSFNITQRATEQKHRGPQRRISHHYGLSICIM